ncbi:hypothetical protein Goarm_011673 [Gossypium armourianum]|uniref:Uncharacterized protein n=1 Tax=Gossypium armourianum TaxID=34283 RepID=A0A7J9IXJ2_9ROSI|nr:hypothetical protein [Gossypium armourianum]
MRPYEYGLRKYNKRRETAFWEGRLGAHRRRVHNSAPLPEDPSRQSLF